MSERMTTEEIQRLKELQIFSPAVHGIIHALADEVLERRAADSAAMRWEYEEPPREQDADAYDEVMYVSAAVMSESILVADRLEWTPQYGPYLRNWRTALREEKQNG